MRRLCCPDCGARIKAVIFDIQSFLLSKAEERKRKRVAADEVAFHLPWLITVSS
jgi:hypothetical protein